MSTEIPISIEDLNKIEVSWDHHYAEIFRELDIAPIRRYAESFEQLLLEQSQTIRKDLKKKIDKMTYDEQCDWYGEIDEIEYTFTKILRYSLFVHSYSLFETRLLRIADDYRRIHKLPEYPASSKDTGITRAQKCLKNFASVQFPEGSAWQDILVFRLIRNQIVHNDGNLPQGHSKKRREDRRIIEKFIKRNNNISFDLSESFELSKQFIVHVIATFNKFLDELCANLKM